MSRARLVSLVGLALLLSSAVAHADPVSPPTTTIKRFTGLLSNAGPQPHSPGQQLHPAAQWVDFICDPRLVNWNIRVTHLGPFLPTYYLNDPHICDHVEILMFYYDPPVTFPGIPAPVDGTAIYILKIP